VTSVEMKYSIDSLTVGPFQTNIYLLSCLESSQAAIIDAGGDADGLMNCVAKRGVDVTQILQTHAHIDHIGAISEIKKRTGAPIYLHPADLPLYLAAPQQGAFFGIPIGDDLPPIDHELGEPGRVKVGELEARLLHLPGHSPGGVAFYFESIGALFSGDVLFAGSIGRTDLPGSDIGEMRLSLERLKELDGDVRVLPGHGPETTIGEELRTNPFLRSGAW
jgi:hydroxyacylglutathione hydrolase